jgi:choline dehydrogenase
MNFDYIIVGAGSAGVVLASRLTERAECSVLLLEAGCGSGGLWSRIPLGVGKVLNDSSKTWKLLTEPNTASNNIPREWVSGKCLGGSSAVNGLVFVRGQSEKYNEWGAHCPGWSFDDCLPYFKKLENWSGAVSAMRASGGPIDSTFAERNPLADRFLEACQESGYPLIDDYNAEDGCGASYLQLTAFNGVRKSVADGYLRHIRDRKNLKVIVGALAQQITFRGAQATGVKFTHDGIERQAFASREVLVCGGAVRSPQLLELSGIGNPEILLRHNIGVIYPNPAVGENLQDHIMIRVCYRTSDLHTINYLVTHPLRLGAEFLKYILFRTGSFTDATLKATLYANTNGSADSPNIRIQLSTVSAINRIPDSIRSGLDRGSAFQIGVYSLYPKSRGATHIRSSIPGDAPVTDPGYFTDPDDLKETLSGLRLIRRLAAQDALSRVISDEIRPGADVNSDEALVDYVRTTGQTCWHPVGTCRMGTDSGSVVDGECRVRGVNGLRVVDASVFPFLTSSNTNVPTIMLAEKIAATL